MYRRALLAAGLALGGQLGEAQAQSSAAAGTAPAWSGLYLGVNAGYGRNHADVFDSFSAPGIGKIGVTSLTTEIAKGAIGGGQVGYNWRSGLFLFGLEGDISASDQTYKTPYGCDVGGAAVPGCTVHPDDSVNWFGSVRARAGVANDKWLAYASVGPAWQNLRSSGVVALSGVGNFNAFSSSTTRSGIAIGGGVERALNDKWSVGLETLYLDTGTKETTDSPLPAGLNAVLSGPPGFTLSESHHLTDEVLRLRLNYRY